MRKAIRILHHRIYEFVGAPTVEDGTSRLDLLPILAANVGLVLTFRQIEQEVLFRSFLAGGGVGFFAAVDGRVVAHAWGAGPGEVYAANGYFRLRSGESLIHHCSVDPNYRGRGIYTALISKLAYTLVERGDSRVFIDTNVLNLAAIRGIESAGAVFVTDAWFAMCRQWLLFRSQKT